MSDRAITQDIRFTVPFQSVCIYFICPVQLKNTSMPFHIVTEVKPPLLSVDPSSIVFVDRSSNNAIDAGETDLSNFELLLP